MKSKLFDRWEVVRCVIIAAVLSLLLSSSLTIMAVTDDLYTGPHVNQDLVRSFGWYAVYSLIRLTLVSFLIIFFMAILGSVSYLSIIGLLYQKHSDFLNIIYCCGCVFFVTLGFFISTLFYNPSAIVVSFNYDLMRLIPLWSILNPSRIYIYHGLVIMLFIGPVLIYIIRNYREGRTLEGNILLGFLLFYPFLYLLAYWEPSPPKIKSSNSNNKYNILMLGSDTLRADRLGVNGNIRGLTPNIDMLAKKGVNFSSCIVPIARTAPSLSAIFTSTWPMTNRIRFNFIADEEVDLPAATLPEVLGENGYVTAALGDWAAGDLAKLDFGFEKTFVPEDQWNIKYLLRQGPKDLRLFLTLFLHNKIGKIFLPEIYYLAGVPLTSQMGKDARKLIGEFANGNRPFFLNVFIASTHGPFGSPWPYYHMYSEPNYHGRSMFAMPGLSSPDEIVKAQEKGREHFEVRQIMNLYDGAVKSFDDEVGKFINYLHETGLDHNTIIVIYSDHGVDLFEGATWGQGNIVSDYGYRIPLVIYHPRIKIHETIETTIRSIDIAPTLVDMVDIAPSDEWEGESLLPMIKNSSLRKHRVAYAETGIWIAKVPGQPANRIDYPSVMDLLEVRNEETGTLSIKKKYKDILVRAKSRMVRKGQWELVYYPLKNGALNSLYNVNLDPALLHDVSSIYPEAVSELQLYLDNFIMRDK